MIQTVREEHFFIKTDPMTGQIALYIIDYRDGHHAIAQFGNSFTKKEEDQVFAEMLRDRILSDGCIDLDGIRLTDPIEDEKMDKAYLKRTEMRDTNN